MEEMFRELTEKMRVECALNFVEEFVKYCNGRDVWPSGGALIDDRFGFPVAQVLYIG